MAKSTAIRFLGEKGKAHYYIKVGSIDISDPPERVFDGGEEISVTIQPNTNNPECVDLTFDDGEIAIEVPQEFFVIVEKCDSN